MGKKGASGGGENSKAAAGRARKEETKQAKQAAVDAEARRKEEASWQDGAKGAGKKEDKAAKAAERAAKKAEAAALLEAEEKALAKSAAASASAAAKKSAAKPPSRSIPTSLDGGDAPRVVETYGASNLDDALALMDTVTTTKAQKQQQAGMIEQHPERRAKAAFKAFEERRIPELKKEKPGLRLSQIKELVFKEWQKSPENPFNQAQVAYNATKEDKQATMEALHEETERRLRIH